MRDSVIADVAASDGLGGCSVDALVVLVCVECLLLAVAHSRGRDCDSLLRDFTGWAAFVVKRVSSDKSPYSFNYKLIHFGL
jgi:hypothetical protein